MNSLSRLRQAMADQSVDALLVTTMLNVRWLTGFSGSSGIALVTPDDAVFVTDSRYTIQAQQEVTGMEAVSFSSPTTQKDVVSGILQDWKVKKLHFEPTVTVGTLKSWENEFEDIDWVDAPSMIEELRKIKSAEEIQKIRNACKLADACIDHISGRIQAGVSEYDLGLEVEFFYRRQGAELAFDPIVVSGPNSARPHGTPGERVLQVGDFVTVDCGGRLEGYCSDITRTFVVGEASDRHQAVYGAVLESQLASCNACRVGNTGIEVDAVAREILGKHDLAQYFGHGLGHGLGLNVHDPGSLSPRSTDTLQAGMVMTVEPGVYIEGFGGVRIEDDVLVTENGPEILTSWSKELTVLG